MKTTTSPFQIKVCGLREPENIAALTGSAADFFGYIFYEASPRFVGKQPDATFSVQLPQHMQRVGVFVNEALDKVKGLASKFSLDLVQLHGQESPAYCEALQNQLKVVKAFPIAQASDFIRTRDYQHCDYLLFDTAHFSNKSEAGLRSFGGSGKKFNWEVLETYTGETPFFLSGGICPEDVEALFGLPEKIRKKITAVDINSGFESSPGLKDVNKVKAFCHQIKSRDHAVHS